MTQGSSVKNWGRELKKALIHPSQFVKTQLMSSEDAQALEPLKSRFDFRIPHIFVEDIKKGNQSLRHQFVPTQKELVIHEEELVDPIGDEPYTPVPGITHRYPDRVLLKPTYLCGVYCRFCFRRYKVSQAKHNLTPSQFEEALSYLRSHPEIWEVILTGGDPLVLSTTHLKRILSALETIPHIQVLRFHSRIPVVLPARIDDEFLAALSLSSKRIWIAIHANSASEFTPENKVAIARLIKAGFSLVLQSVLLKNVNDSHEQLSDLFKTAVSLGVKPYYLHYPDLAKGTSHFRIPLEQAIALYKRLRGTLSGLCIPQFIVDIPGGRGKVSINPHTALQKEPHVWEFESPLDGSKIVVKYPSTDGEYTAPSP